MYGSWWNTWIDKSDKSPKQDSGNAQTCLRNNRFGDFTATTEKFKKNGKL